MVPEFTQIVCESYRKSLGKDAKVYVSSIRAGTSRIETEETILQ
jgi:hypothetical protein